MVGNKNRKDDRILSFGISAVALLAACAAPEMARASADEGQAAPASAGEIVVTAQKRAQNLNDVPITISAFSGKTLEKAGVTNATDLVKLTPALNLAGAYGGQILSFSIRGVTQQDFSEQAEGPVAVYVDDGYLALNNAAGVGLFDLDHVEVLKGPQGTLFGRNATGGLVNILTRKPQDTADGYITASYGSYNDSRIEGAIGGPIANGLDFRIAGALESNSSYIKNLSPTGDNLGGAHSYAFRAHLLYKPSSDLSVLLSASTSKTDASWAPYYILASKVITNESGVQQNAVLVPGPWLAGPTTPGGSGSLYAEDARGSGDTNELTTGSAKVTWNFGPAELSLLTNYAWAATNLSIDATGTPAWVNNITSSKVGNFSQELRLYGHKAGFRWYVGLYYLNINARLDPNRNQEPAFGVLIDDFNHETTNSYSGFGQVEIDLMPKLTLISGGRVTQEDKQFAYHSVLYTIGADNQPLVDLGPARSPYTGHQASTLVNAKVQLEYRPDTGLLFYGGWSRGSKAGNFTSPFSGSTAFPDSELSYKPETLNSYEVGTKLSLADRKVNLNAAAFYYDYHNYQAFEFMNISDIVINRPATTYGGEADIDIRPFNQFKVSASASYTHNIVKDVPISGVTADRIAPYTPRWDGTINATYGIPLKSGNIEVYGGAKYSGKFYFGISNFDSTFVPAYWMLDARITWIDSSALWRVSAFVNNLTNTRNKTVGFDLSGICGCTQVAYGRPRWAGVSVTRNF